MKITPENICVKNFGELISGELYAYEYGDLTFMAICGFKKMNLREDKRCALILASSSGEGSKEIRLEFKDDTNAVSQNSPVLCYGKEYTLQFSISPLKWKMGDHVPPLACFVMCNATNAFFRTPLKDSNSIYYMNVQTGEVLDEIPFYDQLKNLSKYSTKLGYTASWNILIGNDVLISSNGKIIMVD